MGKILGAYLMPHPPIIIPEVGKGEEEKIQATYKACEQIADEIGRSQPDTIIIITPHGPLFQDAIAISDGPHIAGDLGRFGAPDLRMKREVNQPFVDTLVSGSSKENILIARINEDSKNLYGVEYTLDHGSLVPLYFVNKTFQDYKIVHITYGMVEEAQLYKFGMLLKKTVKESDTNVVLIASGDLSHKLAEDGPYDFNPLGEKFDKELIALLEKGDILKLMDMDPHMVEEAGECGLRSVQIMLGALDDCDIKGQLLSYEGPFGVGYAVMKFNLAKCDPYVSLAKESLTYYLKYRDYIKVSHKIPFEMRTVKHGVFVSLKKDGNLRGCIGTIFPRMDCVAHEIIRNAVAAGLHDPRFVPVTVEELKDLEFSVDVLTQPEEASIEGLDPKKYGVIVKSGDRLGVLLPDLEGVDRVSYQLSIALEKAGIDPDEFYTIERFEVVRHS